MPENSQLRIVTDSAYWPELVDYATRLSDVDQHILAFAPKPGARTIDWIASDLLGALGKRREVSGAARNERERLRLAGVWLAAEEIRELVIVGAESLRGNIWRVLLDLCLEVDCALTLIVSGTELSRGKKEFVRDWNFDRVTLDEAIEAWPKPAEPGAASSPSEPMFPVVPRTYFAFFRASARELMSAEGFEIVDALFAETFKRANETFPWNGAGEEQLAQWMHALVAGAETYDQALVQIRATQAACFAQDYLLDVDDARFAAQAEDASITPLNADIAHRLRWYQQPRYAAIGAIVVATGLPGWGLEALKIGDVAADGSSIETVNGRRSVPQCARALVRAQLIDRTTNGAGTDDPLFGGEAQGRDAELSVTGRSLQMLCKKVSFETGIRLAGHWTSKEAKADRGWMSRHGIRLRKLTP